MPRLRQHERYRTVGMVQAGMRQMEVANHFGCSKHTSRQTLTAMDCVHITKSQDKIAHRHERLGTQTIYENMESTNVSIKIHSHDRNMAVNNFVKETQFTTN